MVGQRRLARGHRGNSPEISGVRSVGDPAVCGICVETRGPDRDATARRAIRAGVLVVKKVQWPELRLSEISSREQRE